MKFKIVKSQFDMLKPFFEKASKDSYYELELELVSDTLTEAIIKQQIENSAFHKGYHIGFREGLYQGKKPELRYCGCGCGGNNCFMRFCDENCKYYNK